MTSSQLRPKAVQAYYGHSGVAAVVREFERDGVLSSHQAELLRVMWPLLGEEWRANPYFGTVRDHTAALIDRLRARRLSEQRRVNPIFVADAA
jgi:hypothetical protein